MNKKVILLIVLLIAAVLALSSCGNRSVGFDPNQTFTKASILLEGEWREININSWRDFEDSDVVQVVASDGTVYLTHYVNMVLKSK